MIVAEPSSDFAGSASERLTLTKWLILIMAAIGFAFDIYELLMLPLVLPPALAELLPHAPPGSSEFNLWRALMFWVPAMAGGIFGLLGGYLTDRLGRRRVLTWSILLYAMSAFAAGFATSMPMLLVLRSTTFIGVCVEFVAAVAWLAELFPNHQQRERALGYTQAFSSVGGLLVGGAFLLAVQWSPSLPAIVMPEFLASMLGSVTGAHAPWRYTLMSGLIPALPLIVIRPFLPESPVWKQKKEAGTLRRPSFRELFAPHLRKTTIVTTVMVACAYGAAFGAIQQIPQIVPGLPEVRTEVAAAKEAARDKLAALPREERGKEAKQIERRVQGNTAGQLSLAQEVGGLVGRFLLALLVVRIVSRRTLIRVFQIPGLVVLPFVFAYLTVNNRVLFTISTWQVTLLHFGIFFAGLLTVAQFSFWGNYLPVVYPVHLRGTGESVAANIGGRMIGTSFAALTSLLSGLSFIPGDDDPTRVAYTAAGIAFLVYFLGFLGSFWLPEPKEDMFRE
jgi:MFS family permease